MVKKLLLALLALHFFAGVATAQTFPKPPDVPDYVEVVPQFATGSAANTQKAWNETPPLITDGNELADIPSEGRSELLKTSGISYVDVSGFGGSSLEMKFRSLLEVTHILYDDPIRNFGQPGTSHCHLFFGNRAVNAYSTFQTLRDRARKYSKAGGGGLNGTGYWMPCMVWENAFGDGKNYAVLPETVVLYYNEDVRDSLGLMHRIPLGLRYVTGFWMDDAGAYMDSVLQAANAANAAAGGSSSRYKSSSDGSTTTSKWLRHGWGCYNSSKTTVIPKTNGDGTGGFVNADGTDPWAGNCPSGGFLHLSFNGASCWDGKNLWSPGGYKHIIPALYDTLHSESICPQNYYRLPALQFNIHFKHNGFDHFKNWKLSSDGITGTANTGSVAGAATSRGTTFHSDWFGAWDQTTFNSWLDFCIGTNNATPHTCDNSTINATERLITTGLDNNPQTGKAPQVTQPTRNNTVASDMWLLPSTAQNGGTTLTVHGH